MVIKLIKIFLWLTLFTHAYGGSIDVDKILKDAEDQNKTVLFFHHIPGCPYCKKMLGENFIDSNITDVIKKNFIYVDIYTADESNVTFKGFSGTHKEFSVHIGAKAYPATIFMNPKGEVLHRAIGYRNIDEHYADITYISSQGYQSMDLESYIEKLELEKE